MPDPIDPCAEADRLRALRTALITGQAESSIRFDDEEVRYAKADMARLDSLIARYERECSIQQGATPKRTRFARRAAFRPY